MPGQTQARSPRHHGVQTLSPKPTVRNPRALARDTGSQPSEGSGRALGSGGGMSLRLTQTVTGQAITHWPRTSCVGDTGQGQSTFPDGWGPHPLHSTGAAPKGNLRQASPCQWAEQLLPTPVLHFFRVPGLLDLPRGNLCPFASFWALEARHSVELLPHPQKPWSLAHRACHPTGKVLGKPSLLSAQRATRCLGSCP